MPQSISLAKEFKNMPVEEAGKAIASMWQRFLEEAGIHLNPGEAGPIIVEIWHHDEKKKVVVRLYMPYYIVVLYADLGRSSPTLKVWIEPPCSRRVKQ